MRISIRLFTFCLLCPLMPTLEIWSADALADGYEVREPTLFRTRLWIEPTAAQMQTLPVFGARWKFAPETAKLLGQRLAAEGFPAPFIDSALAQLRIDPETGEGAIAPQMGLAELVPAELRRTWWSLLGEYAANRSYRWPLAMRPRDLDRWGQEDGFGEAARLVRRLSVVAGEYLLFADLFALEGAFRGDSERRRFFQHLIGGETEFVKLVAGDGTPDSALDYWQAGWRNRSLEPFLHAVGTLRGHDRIDLVHLLPRTQRSLLYTFPRDFRVTREPSADNAALAVNFFASSTEQLATLPGRLADWLTNSCESASGDREFGDIAVFENPYEIALPFTLTYVADGILFGRRPSIFGAWELMSMDEVYATNPRFRPSELSWYRIRGYGGAAGVSTPRSLSRRASEPSEWLELESGPWGKLYAYTVNLSPTSQMLERLPSPPAQPRWVFAGIEPSWAMEQVRELRLESRLAAELESLFLGAVSLDADRFAVEPTLELALRTPAEVRNRLFPHLQHGAVSGQYAQAIDIAFLDTPEAAIREYGLGPDGARALRNLVYPYGGRYRLSDYGGFYHGFADTRERVSAFQALMRTQALIVLLQRPEEGEVEAIADHWRLDQQKSVRRILKSFAEAEDMRFLDISHLLPPVARELLNVFQDSEPDGLSPSCYWTAFNFGVTRPDSKLLVSARFPGREVEASLAKLGAEYGVVEGERRLGDVVVYRGHEPGDLRHACAYVAADIVFTKNGVGSANPWCLMRIEDMDAIYLKDGVFKEWFRKRE